MCGLTRGIRAVENSGASPLAQAAVVPKLEILQLSHLGTLTTLVSYFWERSDIKKLPYRDSVSNVGQNEHAIWENIGVLALLGAGFGSMATTSKLRYI